VVLVYQRGVNVVYTDHTYEYRSSLHSLGILTRSWVSTLVMFQAQTRSLSNLKPLTLPYWHFVYNDYANRSSPLKSFSFVFHYTPGIRYPTLIFPSIYQITLKSQVYLLSKSHLYNLLIDRTKCDPLHSSLSFPSWRSASQCQRRGTETSRCL
jgi:hypothetical protein